MAITARSGRSPASRSAFMSSRSSRCTSGLAPLPRIAAPTAISRRAGTSARCWRRSSGPRRRGGGLMLPHRRRRFYRVVLLLSGRNVRRMIICLIKQNPSIQVKETVTTDANSSDRQHDLGSLAQQARWEVIKTVTSNKAGHIGGPLSMMDLLVSLYFGELRVRPEEPDWPDRARFILSKGHAAIGLYAVLALRGYLDVDELSSFDKGDSRLQGHPDVTRLPGLDASTGSLGQGLSVGVGMALGAQMGQKDFHTWVLLGDGEIQEGMIWEAVQVAARYKLSNLPAIVDR